MKDRYSQSYLIFLFFFNRNLFPTENVPAGSLVLCNLGGSFSALHLEWDGSEASWVVSLGN